MQLSCIYDSRTAWFVWPVNRRPTKWSQLFPGRYEIPGVPTTSYRFSLLLVSTLHLHVCFLRDIRLEGDVLFKLSHDTVPHSYSEEDNEQPVPPIPHCESHREPYGFFDSKTDTRDDTRTHSATDTSA